MGRPRVDLQTILVDLLGSEHVYFQPPSTVEMTYPCIVYKRDDASEEFANNNLYHRTKRYLVTHIGRDPDSDVPDSIAQLPRTTMSRSFVADNLNHDVFIVYF